MNRKHKLIIFGALLAGFFYYHLYSAQAITGVVVDSVSGAPIHNAKVIVGWHSQSPGYHSAGRNRMETQEAVTDSEGEFSVNGWRIKILLRFFASVDIREPVILIRAPHYETRRIYNGYPSEEELGLFGKRDTHGFYIKWHGSSKFELQADSHTDDSLEDSSSWM